MFCYFCNFYSSNAENSYGGMCEKVDNNDDDKSFVENEGVDNSDVQISFFTHDIAAVKSAKLDVSLLNYLNKRLLNVYLHVCFRVL